VVPFIESIRHVTIATLAITETSAYEHLYRGEPVLALQMTLFGCAMTAMIAGTMLGISTVTERVKDSHGKKRRKSRRR